MREYNSFDEIERDLKLLKLQNEVDKEMVLLRYNLAKSSLSPLNIAKRIGVKVFKSALIYKSASKVMGFVADKFSR